MDYKPVDPRVLDRTDCRIWPQRAAQPQHLDWRLHQSAVLVRAHKRKIMFKRHSAPRCNLGLLWVCSPANSILSAGLQGGTSR